MSDIPPEPTCAGAAPADRAQLALLLELSGTPKPGNVDRERDHSDLCFEQFLAGAVGARPGLRASADPGAGLGAAFETAVAGMARQRGENTQFGALLLLVPLVRATAAGEGPPTRDRVRAVAEATTVDDAAAFYRAFEHASVAVDDPPEGMDDLDVRRGADAVPAVRERGLSLADVLAAGAERDGVAAEWAGGFERSFRAADWIVADDGPVADRGAHAFLRLLGEEPDSHVVTGHGRAVAESVTERARDLAETDADRATVTAFAETLLARGINPGTTADLVAAGLYLALERGIDV